MPGNELRVHDTINQLAQAGAEVLHQENAPVHVSGHANSEEIRTMLALVRPKAVMPIHGEFRMLAAHARLAREAGVPADGDRARRERQRRRADDATASRIVDRVEAGVTFVDGLGVGDIGDVALRDRRHLSEDGVLIVVATLARRTAPRRAAGADRARLRRAGRCSTRCAPRRDEILRELLADDVPRSSCSRSTCTTAIGQLVYDRTRRRPMILPVVVEV